MLAACASFASHPSSVLQLPSGPFLSPLEEEDVFCHTFPSRLGTPFTSSSSGIGQHTQGPALARLRPVGATQDGENPR